MSRRKFGFNVVEQIENAIRALEQNKFLLLIDDRQVLHLDDPIHINDSTTVTFLRLAPLQRADVWKPDATHRSLDSHKLRDRRHRA